MSAKNGNETRVETKDRIKESKIRGGWCITV